MFCRHCGKQIEDDSMFCRLCGGNVAVDKNDTKKGQPQQAGKTPATAALPTGKQAVDADDDGEFVEDSIENYRRIKLSPEAMAREQKLKKEKLEKERTNQMLRRVVLNQLLKETDVKPVIKKKKGEPKADAQALPGTEPKLAADPRINTYMQAMSIKKGGKSK